MADKDFTTLEALQEYLEGAQIKAVRASTESLVREEAKKMWGFLDRRVNEYYSLYTPRYMYDSKWAKSPQNRWPEGRTYQFRDSVSISPLYDDNGYISITVGFFPDTHRSIFGGTPGFVPILLNEGWEWKKGPAGFKRRPYHLAYYHPMESGWQFVENAIRDYVDHRGSKVEGLIEIWKVAKYNGKNVKGSPKRLF